MAGGKDNRGTWLVLGQFLCIAVLAVAGSWMLPWWAWALFSAGILLVLWAAVSLGANNLTVLPAPREGNTLSKRGIYARIRHPMYLSILLCGAALAVGAPTAMRWLTLAVLIAVLVVKIRHEEARLTRLHHEYPEVMKGVARLLPGLW
ncbi:MAG: isoprenylcysteine carboxylmethyltransferase family protein [Bacteroidetes bacterium]|nr:isoprenylcysteine carboxylmethyltransferase family protein [Bacteroidota bacterium]